MSEPLPVPRYGPAWEMILACGRVVVVPAVMTWITPGKAWCGDCDKFVMVLRYRELDSQVTVRE